MGQRPSGIHLLHAYMNAAATLNAAAAPYNIKTYDLMNAYNTNTYTYTFPWDGEYLIVASAFIATGAGFGRIYGITNGFTGAFQAYLGGQPQNAVATTQIGVPRTCATRAGVTYNIYGSGNIVFSSGEEMASWDIFYMGAQ